MSKDNNRVRTARRLAVAGAGVVMAALAAFGLASPAEASSPTNSPVPHISAAQKALAENQWDQVKAYIAAHPLDYAGIDALTEKLYHKGFEVKVNGIDHPVSADEASAVLAQRSVVPAGAMKKVVASPADVPLDAFTVTFAFIPRPNTGFYPFAGYGSWDFRDDYVNGSAPDDIASNRMSLAASSINCDHVSGNTINTYDYQGNLTGAGYIQDAGAGTSSPIAGIRDSTSGFGTNEDHGYLLSDIDIECGGLDPNGARSQGEFTLEHNQDGGNVVSVSANFGAFSVSYSGSPSHLQKSSGVATWTQQ